MRTIYLFFLVLLFISCGKRAPKTREHRQEYGYVVAKEFKGETNASGNSVGFTTDGNITIGVSTYHEREKFNVVFRCEHGSLFTIDDANLYEKVSEKDTVLIDYIEIKRGDKIIDFDFLDANKK